LTKWQKRFDSKNHQEGEIDKIKSIFEMVLDFLKNSFAKENLLVTLAIIGLIAALMAIIIPIIHSHFKDSSDKKAKISQSYKIFNKKTSKLSPKELLGLRAYNEKGFHEKLYLKRKVHEELKELLNNKKNVLIMGTPLAGKTRILYEVLKELGEFCISYPNENILSDAPFPPKKEKSIIIFDDLDNYVSNQNLKPFIDKAIINGFIIAATCKAGAEEKEILTKLQLDKLFFKVILIENLVEEELNKFKKMAKDNDVKLLIEQFNGTIGSLLLPLDEMKRRFKKYPKQKQDVMKVVKKLFLTGIYKGKGEYSVSNVEKIYKTFVSNFDKGQFENYLRELEQDSFLTCKYNETIEVEEAYLQKPEKGEIVDLYPPETEEKIFDDVFAVFKDAPDSMLMIADKANKIGITKHLAEYSKKAIRFYNEILSNNDINKFPDKRAKIQNNLGLAYVNLAEIENPKQNLLEAIKYYEESLKIRAANKLSYDYAETLSNLGLAFAELADLQDVKDENKKEYLRKASECYNGALKITTIDKFQREYAIVHTNLGLVYLSLAEVDNEIGNVTESIKCFNEALKVVTIDKLPFHYAVNQINLGVAYMHLDDGKVKTSNLMKSIEYFNEALKVITIEKFPYEYGKIQRNFGVIYKDFADIEDRKENLIKTVKYFDESLKVFTLNNYPLKYTNTHNDLGDAYGCLAEMEDKERNLKKAIENYKEELKVYNENNYPDKYKIILDKIHIAEKQLNSAKEEQ
jgi:tetratricopeptide (TPR) repeat protein